MKRITFISKVFFLLLTFSFSNCQDSTAQKQATQSAVLAADDFEAKLALPNIQIVDVRTPDEYKAGHIGNAININFYDADFKAQMAKLDKSKPLAVYCGVGGRSAKAAAIVSELGFKTVYDLQGGMSVWRSKGKKEVK